MSHKTTFLKAVIIIATISCARSYYSGEYEDGENGEHSGNPAWVPECTVYHKLPMMISCNSMCDDYYSEQCFNRSIEKCVIEKNGAVVYNETMKDVDLTQKGLLTTADDSWNDADVSITTTDLNPPQQTQFSMTMVLKRAPEHHSCSGNSYDPVRLVQIGKSIKLQCQGDDRWRLSEEQFSNLTSIWYHGCKKLRSDNINYRILQKPYKFDGMEFDELQILNASLHSTAGSYYCMLEKFDASEDRKATKHILKSYNVCVERRYLYQNQPDIATDQEQYVSAPGSTLTIIARGHTGADQNSMSRIIVWNKIEKSGNDKTVCKTRSDNQNEKCSVSFHKNPSYCEPMEAGEIQAALDSEPNDNFTAVYTLRNLTEADEGQYKVMFLSTQDTPSVNFTIKVQHSLTEHKILTVAFITVGVPIVIAVIVVYLLHSYRTDLKYFYKKIFRRKTIRDSRPLAYMVYSPDIFQHEERSPYQAVREILGEMRYYDPAHPGLLENVAGRLEAEHVADKLRQCMTMMVFITEELLDKESMGMEEFEAYMGFNENIQNDLPIIFIYTKYVKQRMKRCPSNSSATFKELMRRERNTVIFWDENHPNTFRRGLYVALLNAVDSVLANKVETV